MVACSGNGSVGEKLILVGVLGAFVGLAAGKGRREKKRCGGGARGVHKNNRERGLNSGCCYFVELLYSSCFDFGFDWLAVELRWELDLKSG